MNENYNKIKFILLELKSASLQCPKTEQEIHNLAQKYDMLFLGEQLNIIYSDELCHSLNSKFDMQIDLEELNQIIPAICAELHMACKPMKKLNDMSSSAPYAFNISLFE